MQATGMRLLLDESVPRRLAASFPDRFKVQTVPQMGWAGTGNGALLLLAANRGFDALITVDRGIAHEQNPSSLPIPVVVILAARGRGLRLSPDLLQYFGRRKLLAICCGYSISGGRLSRRLI